jgi:hypothetical protein
MSSLTGPGRSSYHFVDADDGVTLVFRTRSNACVGRVYHATARGDLWTAELGRLRVLTPYSSREEALGAVCAYADKNPQLAV